MNARLWLALPLALTVSATFAAGVASASGGTGGGGGGVVGAPASGADLQIGGSASTNSPNGSTAFTYTFQIKNSGPAMATSVVFTDPLPTGVVPNFATMNGSILPCAAFGGETGGTYFRCDVGTIVKGGQATVVVNANSPSTVGSFTNTATVRSGSVDPNLANNSATVTAQVKAGTGGLCKGGICDLLPPPTASPCALLGNVSAPVGYYSIWAAIWNTMTVQSCSTGTETVSLEVTETNVATGSVDYDVIYPMTMGAGQNLSLVLDNDFAAFSTTYLITMTVRDSASNVLATSSVGATTPGPQ